MARSVSQLKNQARREEQRENWSRAIELYAEAIQLSEETGEVSLDLSLYNRIGDLYRRQGDVDQAVHHYLEAVDHYAEQGLHTGAIALCNKIQRLAPDRDEVYRKLARLHAATGLVAEARNSLDEYVERKETAGEDAAAREARAEVARLVGDRPLLFEATAAMAEAGGEERERALEALLDAWREADEPGEELRSRILAIDPDLDLPGGEAAEETAPAGSAAEEDGRDAAEEAEETGDDADDAAGSEDGAAEGVEATGVAADGEAPTDPAGAEGAGTDREASEDAEAEAAEAAGAEAAEAATPPPAEGSGGESPGEEPGSGTDAPGHVDLGERIRRRLASDAAAGEAAEGGPADYDFDDMLVGFRVQVDETEGEADPAAHLELGVALRQMGRLDDAIREFQVATRAPEPPLRAFELLGEAFIEKDLHGVAIRVLTRALHLPGRSEPELLGVLYQLGIAHRSEANHRQALDCFERVFSIDIDFRDVAERMEAARREA